MKYTIRAVANRRTKIFSYIGVMFIVIAAFRYTEIAGVVAALMAICSLMISAMNLDIQVNEVDAKN